MARPTNEELKRKSTKIALEKALADQGKIEQYYKDHLDLYMEFYDNLVKINKELLEYNNKTINDRFISLTKEKRMISKEMRSILTYLNVLGNNPINGL